MGFKTRIQLVAQIVGFVTIGLLSIWGALAIASGSNPAWAALGQASPAMSARVPNVINYQGMLRRPDGSVINGTYAMTFRLYDSPEGGKVVHTEQLSNVIVRDGLFTVLLGDGHGNPIQAGAFKGPLYIGIQVGNDAEMLPRQRIAPVPYAVQLTDGVYVDESGNVGIGTTDPGTTLDVNGNAHMSGNVGIGTSAPAQTLHLLRDDKDVGIRFMDPHDAEFSLGIDRDDHSFKINSGQNIGDTPGFVLRHDSGNVGIGTTEPTAALHVDGDIAWSGQLTDIEWKQYWVWSRNEGKQEERMLHTSEGACFLTSVNVAGIGVWCDIVEYEGDWFLRAHSSDGRAECSAVCLEW